MANSILIKRSAVPAKVPATTDLQLGEIALNTYDGKLFLKKNNGADAIIEIGAVTSVAGRTGAITLTTGDVTTALGFTPYNSTNPSNYITSAGAPVQSVAGRSGVVVLTGADVGLGLAENKSSATIRSEISSANVTTALGFTPISTAAQGAVNGVATLDSTGKIATSQLPSITITDTFVVVSQAAMLALTVQTGDVAVRTDLNKSFIVKGVDGSVIGNWQELLTPTDAVLSVAGRTGAVVLSSTDVGLNLAENKSSATIRGELTSGNVTTALGFTPYNSTNPTGYITSAGAPVQSVAGRTGAINLTFADVSGIVPIANGGTGSSSAVGALSALGALGTVNSGLGAGVDLNTITATGLYYQNADSNISTGGLNWPVAFSGKLTVTNSTQSIGLWQEYSTYNGPGVRTFRRQYYNGSWSPWLESMNMAQGAVVNPAAAKAGDIKVVSSVISIYDGSAWKQVFPAVYA